MPDPHFWTSFNLNYLFTRLYLQIVIRLQHVNFGSETIESITDGESKAWSRKSIKGEVLVAQLCPTLGPHRLQPTRLLCPWDFPGKDTGVGCHFLLQGIFPTQGSKPGLLHCRQMLYWLSYKGSPGENRARVISPGKAYYLWGSRQNEKMTTELGCSGNSELRGVRSTAVFTWGSDLRRQSCAWTTVQPLEERISIRGQRPGLTTGALCDTEFY